MSRWIAFILGVFYIDILFHTTHAHALGFEATTIQERLWALFFVLLVTLLVFYICMKVFPPSFFHGVIFASGFFASFDIIVIHWIFQLHRLTEGPEANVLEPILVVMGIGMIIFAILREKKLKTATESM